MSGFFTKRCLCFYNQTSHSDIIQTTSWNFPREVVWIMSELCLNNVWIEIQTSFRHHSDIIQTLSQCDDVWIIQTEFRQKNGCRTKTKILLRARACMIYYYYATMHQFPAPPHTLPNGLRKLHAGGGLHDEDHVLTCLDSLTMFMADHR